MPYIKTARTLFMNGSSDDKNMSYIFFRQVDPNVSSTSSSYKTLFKKTAKTGSQIRKVTVLDSAFDSSASVPHLYITGRLKNKIKLKVKV